MIFQFPVNDRKACLQAWKWLHLPYNTENHSPEEIAEVEEKIKAAWKRITGEDWSG